MPYIPSSLNIPINSKDVKVLEYMCKRVATMCNSSSEMKAWGKMSFSAYASQDNEQLGKVTIIWEKD